MALDQGEGGLCVRGAAIGVRVSVCVSLVGAASFLLSMLLLSCSFVGMHIHGTQEEGLPLVFECLPLSECVCI
jgi:hypothetical protein